MELGYKNNTNFKIAFTGMMLALVMLFQFLEKFMPIGGLYMSMNLSIVFIVASVYVVGYWWAFGLLLLRLAIGPALSVGYSTYEMWGHTIQFISGMIYMNLFILLHRFVFKKFDEKFNLLLSGVVTVIVASLLMAFLNALFLTPMYWWLMLPHIKTSILINAKVLYSDPYVKDVAFLGIPNYWAGMMTAFGLGNLAKYTVVTITFIALWKVVKRYEIPSKKQNKKEVKNVK